ncbi:MAG TPA: LLM class F420-dependent oxidoreductase [Dehalococcoidia bacterium]|nr:LLM class F420-dependent oxidoreductase [Dehalococcoidia bacterium]
MRLGFALPQIGPAAGPNALIAVAKQAEDLGYDSLWVLERLLFPVAPRAPYAASADGSLPEAYKNVLDPIGTLVFVAVHTSRVSLGTSVLDLPFHNPLTLGRQIATLDVLSNGRAALGLGLGWSPDEFEAAGVEMHGLGKRADEFIEALNAVWGPDPQEFKGKYYSIPRSFVGPKPVQQPRPPLYLAAYAPGSMARVARLADGWNPVGIPLEGMRQMFGAIQGMAREAGRAPGAVSMVVRANCVVLDEPISSDRFIFTGSLEQIAEDVRATEALGAAELFFDVNFSPGVRTTEDVLGLMAGLWRVSGTRTP